MPKGFWVKTGVNQLHDSVRNFYVKTSIGGWAQITDAWVKTSTTTWSKFWEALMSPTKTVELLESYTGTDNATLRFQGKNYRWAPTPQTLRYYFRWIPDRDSTYYVGSGGSGGNTTTNPATSTVLPSSTSYITISPSGSNFERGKTNRYYFEVRATGASGTVYSSVSQEDVKIVSPKAPLLSFAVVSSTSVTVTVNSASIDDYIATNRYILYTYDGTSGFVYSGGGRGGFSAGSQTINRTLTSLVPGRNYTVYVLPVTGFSGTTDSNYSGYPGIEAGITDVTTGSLTPTIIMGANTGVTSTQGTINWTSTNQESFSSTGVFSATGSTETSISKTGLSASANTTTYTGTVTVTSPTGQTASANYSLTTPAASFTMPNLIGLTAAQAGDAIVAAGFYYEQSYETFTNNINLDQIVFAQTPESGFVGVPQNAYFDYYVYQASALTAPSISSVSSGNANGPVTVYFSGGSGPYYQIWWSTGSTGTGYDESGSSSPITDNTGPTYAGTWYAYVRSVSSPTNTGNGGSQSISDWSAAYSFTVTEPAPAITYGPCTAYGSPYYSNSSYDCSGNYSYYYTDNYYSQRKQILSNGTWNGSYDYDCPTTSVRTYGNFIQVNGQCGYSPPAPSPTITSGPFISWASGNNFTLSATASNATNIEFQVQFGNNDGGPVLSTESFFMGASAGSRTTGAQQYSWAKTRARANNSTTGLSSSFSSYTEWA